MSSRMARKLLVRAHRGRKPPLRFFADHRSQIKYAKLAVRLIGRRELHAEGTGDFDRMRYGLASSLHTRRRKARALV